MGCRVKEGEVFCLTVMDWGSAFNLLEREEPDLTAGLSDRVVGGLGVHLVKHMADRLTYERHEGANNLTLCFGLREAPGNAPGKASICADK